MGISQAQLDHINGINRRFTEFNFDKYTAGVEEHKNLLSSLPVDSLGNHALEEIADLVNYVYSLVDNVELVRTRLSALKELLQETVDDAIQCNESVSFLEELYDPIRRVEGIEAILYGQKG